jgi:hypothetical protein
MAYWRKESENDADCFTEHHSPSHHRLMRSRFLHVESPITPLVSGEGVLMSTEQAGIVRTHARLGSDAD